MKYLCIYILLVSICMGFTSVKPTDDLKMNWNTIADKDYVVTYVKVRYDSSSQYAIDTRVRTYTINNALKIFPKSSLKLLKNLILDNTNFTTEQEDAACNINYFPYAIIVSRNHEIEGIINIGCEGRVWHFEPQSKVGDLMVLNEKGLKLKEEIFNLK